MRALLLAGGLSMSAVAIVACSPPPPAACSAASCAGCCDASGACQTGDQDTACGASASMCAACGAGFSCQLKSCVRSAAGGGGGGTGGGATGGGGGGGSTGGGTGGGATGGGAGGGATGGSGGGAPVSCQSMTPPTIAITFPVTCPAPTPCGGNPAGTFFYSAACVPQSEFDALVTRIENAGCGPGSVRLNGFDGGLAGSATFSGGTNICRTVRGGVTVSATVTGVCANPTACGFLSSGIAQGGYMGTCAVNAGACDCLVTRAININNGGIFYTVGATTLNITSNQQTFETCLTSTTFSTREVDAGMAEHEPGVATLTRQ